MFSLSHLHERQADRDMIAAATEEFYGRGAAPQTLGPEQRAGHEGKELARLFIVSPEKHENNTATPRRRKKLRPGEAQGSGQSQKRLDDRARLSVQVAIHAGLGDSLSATAEAMGLARPTVRKIAREHNITFKTQPKGSNEGKHQ
ncbi:hypothetical protein [Agrobacterium tumefaciens]|uniref:hypothetical protein n=1 Tax=Agrobacterium tumefaciens TaxID=358 RepID=UPI001573CF80|nr:hypothetical protein [Agrobacterium tumefaciens]